MKCARRGVLLLVMFLAAGAAACSGGSRPEPAADNAPAPASHDAAPAQPAQPASGAGITVNLDEIFPAGPGRELVLNNCQNCHTFVPLVVLQMDRDAWYRNSLDHRERVPKLSDAEFETVYAYLASTFGPGRPVPVLPPELLQSWTTY